MKFSSSAITLALLMMAAPGAMAQNLAVVNGQAIPMAQLNSWIKQLEDKGRPVDDKLRAELKEQLIQREILMQEARKRGVATTDEYKTQMEIVQQEIMIGLMLNEYRKKNPITDEEIKAEYDKFAKSNTGKEYRARHILVEQESQAKAIIAAIKRGEKFEEIAKKQSKDPGSGANGGDLDWAPASNYVSEFAQAMLKLNKGQMTTEPVKSQFGWHVIKVEDMRVAQLPDLKDVKPQIERALQQQKVAEFQKNLREKAKIE